MEVNFFLMKKIILNFKTFITSGSIWGSDYTNNDFKIRSSAGISI